MINTFLVKDVPSVASMADVLFPEKAEMPKVDKNYLNIGISHINS